MASLRSVTYSLYESRDPRLVATFVMVDATPAGGVRHAFAMPRGWMTIEEVPMDDDPDAPQLGSLIVEDPELGNLGAVMVCGSASAAYGESARQVVEHLAARENLTIYRWSDDDKDLNGARAMASSAERIAALRVLPHLGQWIFFWGMGPASRLDKFGGAFKEALTSFQVMPSWAGELED